MRLHIRNISRGIVQVFTLVNRTTIEHFNVNAIIPPGSCLKIIGRGGRMWTVSPHRHLMGKKIRRGCK